MTHHLADIRTIEDSVRPVWPAGTGEVTQHGDAWVATGAVDFTLADVHLVRRHFPGRHVTLDGNAITVWPHTRLSR